MVISIKSSVIVMLFVICYCYLMLFIVVENMINLEIMERLFLIYLYFEPNYICYLYCLLRIHHDFYMVLTGDFGDCGTSGWAFFVGLGIGGLRG